MLWVGLVILFGVDHCAVGWVGRIVGGGCYQCSYILISGFVLFLFFVYQCSCKCLGLFCFCCLFAMVVNVIYTVLK